MYEQINQAIGYLYGLWRYRWSALLISWTVFIAGSLVVYLLPDQYESKATVNIDTSSIMTPLLQGLAVDTDHTTQLDLMTQVMLSRENLLTVIRETDMDHGVDDQESMERLIRKLGRTVSISSRTTSVRGRQPYAATYQIAYKSTSPQHAFNVVSELVNTMLEGYLSTGRTDTIMAQDFLEKQIQEYKKKLEEDEKRLAEFKKKNIAFMPDERGGYYARLRESQSEIERTKSQLQEAKQRYAGLRTELSRQSPVLGGGDSGVTVSRLQQYRDQLAELLTRFTENHPDVQALRSKIAHIEAGNSVAEDTVQGGSGSGSSAATYNPVYQELKVQESAARIEVGRLQIKLAEQQQKLEDFQNSIDIIPQVEADLAKLNRDYEITRERYLSLVERRESAKLAQEVEQSNSTIAFRVIEPPVIPVLPAGPQRLLLLAGALVAAMGAGAGWALLNFLLYPTFVDAKQVKTVLDKPVLGSVMLHLGPDQKRSRRLKLANFLLSVVLLLATFGGALMFAEQGSEYLRALLT